MKTDLKNILTNFNGDPKQKKAVFKKIQGIKRKAIDPIFHEAHDRVFEKIDCLDCANCCKTTSPIFRDADIKRLAKYLKVKPVKFVEDYLRLDQDNDYVLKSSPCYFLNDDNTCSVYEQRPLACKGYPHTDRKNMHQLINLTKKNTEICPAVCEILEQIVKK